MSPTLSAATTNEAGTEGVQVIDLRSPEPRTYLESPISLDERLRRGFAVMAHEIRGPLLGARAAIEQAMMDPEAPEKSSHLLGRACREIDRVSRHVDRLLRWGARIQDGSVRPTDLTQLVDEAVESCVFETGQDRVVVVRGARPTVDVDPDHLRMAVANLVRNALQYSPEDTSVEVSVTAEDDLAIVTVTDHGTGIHESERNEIFDPFVRGRAGALTMGGGIGLFFARSVVDSLGGSVRCESNREGTSFHVWLPLSRKENHPFAS